MGGQGSEFLNFFFFFFWGGGGGGGGGHVPKRSLINQCQIITFLILKSDIIENSRIELRGIVLPSPSNKIKVTFIINLLFNLVHLRFFPVPHRN